MKWIADRIMNNRAAVLVDRISGDLPSDGTIADIGSGTGHNAEKIRLSTCLSVEEFDVSDLHWRGPGPKIIVDETIPADDRRFDAVLLLFVLHYPDSPQTLLREARRISRNRVIVVQSTYSGWLGLSVLRLRELFWGRIAYYLAAMVRLVSGGTCPLSPKRYFTRPELVECFQQAGFVVRTVRPSTWPGLRVSRDLFLLESNST